MNASARCQPSSAEWVNPVGGLVCCAKHFIEARCKSHHCTLSHCHCRSGITFDWRALFGSHFQTGYAQQQINEVSVSVRLVLMKPLGKRQILPHALPSWKSLLSQRGMASLHPSLAPRMPARFPALSSHHGRRLVAPGLVANLLCCSGQATELPEFLVRRMWSGSQECHSSDARASFALNPFYCRLSKNFSKNFRR